jgi:hypothetical protein
MSVFSIQIEEPCSSAIYEYPEDPLGELTEVENAFIKFCFEKNYVVRLQLDEYVRMVRLYPHIVQAWVSLPGMPKRIRSRAATQITFPEVALSIEISPQIGHLERVNIRFHTFGTTHEDMRGEAAAIDVVAALEAFVAELRERIVAAGYMTREQAREYVVVTS